MTVRGAPGEAKEKKPNPFVVAIAIAPAILAVFIFGWIARMSLAHDDATCPFHEVTTRDVAPGVRVREESRRCVEEVEEHRWLVVREGVYPEGLELGRYPLEADQIGSGFPWAATLGEQGRVEIDIDNVDRGHFALREPEHP